MANEESVIKRIKPHNTEAERAVIGSMIMDQDAIVTASEILTGDDFYQRPYGILFDTITELYNEGQPVDILTLQGRLSSKDVPEEFSGVTFLRELIESVAFSTHVRHYAEIVSENAQLRRLIKVNEDIANACYQHNAPVDDIMGETEKRIFAVLQKKKTEDVVPIGQVVLNVIDKIDRMAGRNSRTTGIETGFYDLDYKLSGLQPSDLILLAARPSMGKSAMALNIAINSAMGQGGNFSLTRFIKGRSSPGNRVPRFRASSLS